MKLQTFVQTCAARKDVCSELLGSLERSDVSAVKVLENPDGQPVAEFFLDVLREMSKSSAELVLRLEDDADVNRHLEHNVATWSATTEHSFGCGWLYSPPFSILDIIYKMRPRIIRNRYVCGAVGILFRTEDMPWVISGCEKWFRERGGDAMDLAVSATMHDTKQKMIHVHWPPIVEHRTRVRSSLGHCVRPEHSTMGVYSPDYKRVT